MMLKYLLLAVLLGLAACAQKEDPSGENGATISTNYRIDFSKVEAFDSALVVVQSNGDTILQKVFFPSDLEKSKAAFTFDTDEFAALKIDCKVYSQGELVARSREILTSGDVPQQPALNLAPIAQAGSDSLASQGKEKIFIGSAIDLENGVVGYQWDYDGDGVWDDSLPSAIGFAHVYADTGRYVAFFQVTDDMGMQGRDTLEVVVRNQAPELDSLWFDGALLEDSIVEIQYQYTDSESDEEGATTVQWLRNGKVIAGATSADYAIAYADSGAKLACVVTPRAKTGTIEGEPDTLVLGTVKGFQAPVASNVKISGTARVDSTLRGSYSFSDADGNPEGVTLFRWYRNDDLIAGAMGKTLKLTVDDQDALITFEVVPVSAAGKNAQGKAVRSEETPNVVNPTAPYVTNVSVGGTLYRDSTLKAVYTYKDDNGDKEGGTSFQWYRDEVAVAGATFSTYKITLADRNAHIRVKVTPHAATGEFKDAGVGVMSPPAGPVLSYSAPRVTDVELSGEFKQGGTLTVAYIYSDDEEDPEGASEITWYRDGVQFKKGTTKTYAITKADSGKVISVSVTPVSLVGGVLIGQTVANTEVYPKVTGFRFPEAKNFYVEGLSAVGKQLEIHYDYFDADGDLEATPQITWCKIEPTGSASPCVALSSTGNVHNLAAGDIGNLIVVQLRPVTTTGENLVGEVVTDTFYTQNSGSVLYSNVDYPIISVGKQDWFALNLRYSAGGSIGVVPDPSTGYNEADLGRLYTWNEAVSGTGGDICPDGWRVPSKDEFMEMIDAVGLGLTGTGTDPDRIRSANTSYWNEAGTDLYGLKFQGAGYVSSASYVGLKTSTRIWTSTMDLGISNQSFLYAVTAGVWGEYSNSISQVQASVRCIRTP